MVDPFEVVNVITSPAGERLGNIVTNIMERDGLTPDQMIAQANDLLTRLDRVARRKGITVRQVANESLSDYEAKR